MSVGYHAHVLALRGTKLLMYMPEKLYSMKSEWNAKRHSNANYELHIILQGECTVDVEADHHTLRRQQAILIAPGQYHQPKSTPGDFEHFSLSFTLSNGALLTALQNIVPTSKVFSITESTAQLCKNIFYESASSNSFRHEILQAQLTLLILTVFRQLHVTEASKINIQPKDEIVRIEQMDDFFQKHFSSHATEEMLANHLHLSRRQLSRVVQKRYGTTFREKLTRTRMDHAAWLLRATEKRANEIASLVGYSSEAGFYQMFRRYFGVTPQQYRNQIKKQQKDTDADT